MSAKGFRLSDTILRKQATLSKLMRFNIVTAGGKTFRRFVEYLNALRTALFMLLTLGHNGRSQASTEIFRQFVELRVAVDLDGLFGRVTDDIAVVAPGKVVL